jgi:hypothetical protein
MKPQGNEFDGSSTLFETHQLLQSIAGNDIWLTELELINREHLSVVQQLLQTLCILGICCPAYMAGMFSSYFTITICIAKTNSAILDPLLRKGGNQMQNFMIGPFTFKLSVEEENNDVCKFCDITEDITIPFQITAVDTLKECGPHSNLNFVEFIWRYLAILKLKIYAIVALPFDTPRILNLKHHQAASEGWIMNSLCDMCFDEFKEILIPIIDNCIFELSCKCNLCLRQPPSLRILALQIVSILYSISISLN